MRFLFVHAKEENMGSTARLSNTVEGVEFTIQDGLTTIHAVVLRDALEVYFGADASPQSWLKAYVDHREAIERAAIDRYRKRLGPPLTVLTARRPEDFKLPLFQDRHGVKRRR